MYSFPVELENGKHKSKLGKDAMKEDGMPQYAVERLQSKGETLLSKRCRKKLEPGKTLILNIRRSSTTTNCRELFLQNIHGLHNSIPKHITTLDEKYVLRCLELIRNCALRAAVQNITSKVDILPDDGSNLTAINNLNSNDMAKLAIGRPLISGPEVIVNSSGDWTIGTVSGSQSMINILKSSLLQQFGSSDSNANFGRKDLLGVSKTFYSDFVDDAEKLSVALPAKLENEVKVIHHEYESGCVHKRHESMSSIISSSSDQSSSASGTLFQGMLRCTWKDGLPHHVFTVDGKRDIHVANLSRVESLDDKGLDYVYTFLSRQYGKKECDIHNLEVESVAKMRASTSMTLSFNNSEIRETQFILSLSNGNHMGDIQTSGTSLKKNKRLTRKVVDVFRSSHPSKQICSSKLRGSSAVFEDTPWNVSEDAHSNCSCPGDEGSAENAYVPNLELAAIILKDVHNNNHKKAELGGWGLKFLKKPGNNAPLQASINSECSGNNGECSTSMDILIPAALHGGPRTQIGGPSSLIERWTSGGRCDCGGWDIGCPLTLLNSRSSSIVNSGECKSVDLFMQGSKQSVPIMKMVNINEGLYYIHFQSTLSALQSFAIAVAILHSQTPTVRPKVYRCRSDI